MERPLEWLIAYDDPKDPMQVWVALDQERLFCIKDQQVVIKVTDLQFRKSISAMRSITIEDIIKYWKTDYETIDLFIGEEFKYLENQDEDLNKTNRGYITSGTEDEFTQNILLRLARIMSLGSLE